jgi:hypothetical protein
MAKYIRNITILAIFFVVWLFTDLDYDMKNPDSVDKMFKWSPLSVEWCIDSMAIAANDPRSSNLNGLNCPQIYKIALTKMKLHFSNSVKILSDGLESLKKSPGAKIKVFFNPLSGAESSIYNENSPSIKSLIYDQDQLNKSLFDARSSYAEIDAETSAVLPKMPWSQRFKFDANTYTPVRFEILEVSVQNKTLDNQVSASRNNDTVDNIGNIPKKMIGDRIDDNPSAKPNREEDAANKAIGKPWQDEDGFMHFPDNSISRSPVD